MQQLSDLRLSKNMKYTALYWAMRFSEYAPDIFSKEYLNGVKIEIRADKQQVRFNGEFSFELNTHESFVKLECIDRLFRLGYSLSDICIDADSIYFKGFQVQFITWDTKFCLDAVKDKFVYYKSRLVSGVLEYQSKICYNEEWFDYGLFEQYGDVTLQKKIVVNYNDPNFVFDENRVIQYIGKDKTAIVPNGVAEIESSAFWDNPYCPNR